MMHQCVSHVTASNIMFTHEAYSHWCHVWLFQKFYAYHQHERYVLQVPGFKVRLIDLNDNVF
jgi:hypothetical protein